MKIVGISLVKNEDLFIRQVLLNALDFCDELIVLDNHSVDDTWKIVSDLSSQHSKIQSVRWDNPMDSGRVLYPYIGKDYWVLGLDGDELYSPVDLEILRSKILSGEYQDVYSIRGNSLHCVDIDPVMKVAKGFLCPPSRTMSKLFNLSIVEEWAQDERLDGPPPVLKKGFSTDLLRIDETMEWEDSFFKCVHAAFVPRSSLDEDAAPRPPPHTSSSMGQSRLNFKLEKYRRGDIFKKDISDFLNEGLYK